MLITVFNWQSRDGKQNNMQFVRCVSLVKHFELIFLKLFNCLENLLRCIHCVKNIVVGHTKTNIELLSIGMTMESTTFGSHVAQCFWFWWIIKILHESNVKNNFIMIKGLVSNTRAMERISSRFNYSTHRNTICSASSFDSEIFNSAIREDFMKFSFRIDQYQSCRTLTFTGRMQVLVDVPLLELNQTFLWAVAWKC